MTHALRQTVKDKIIDINPNSYPNLLHELRALSDNGVAELLDLIREMEARAELEKKKRYVRY